MEVVGTNRIVYTGARERAFTVNVTVSASLAPAGGNNRLCNFIIYRNGMPLTASQTSANLREIYRLCRLLFQSRLGCTQMIIWKYGWKIQLIS